MPTYVFRCANGHEFKRIQSVNDKPRSRCPTCRKKCRRMLPIYIGSGLSLKDTGQEKSSKPKE